MRRRSSGRAPRGVCQNAVMVGGAPRPDVLLDRRFDEAFEYALGVHRVHARPGTAIPYIGHLLSVASLVIDDGGDADQAIAALLHAVASDSDDAIQEIGRRFGPRVERIVVACTGRCAVQPGAFPDCSADHASTLPAAPPESWRVSLADALCGARYVLTDLRTHGPAALEWHGGEHGSGYHRSLASCYAQLLNGPLLDEYCRVVTEVEGLAGQGS